MLRNRAFGCTAGVLVASGLVCVFAHNGYVPGHIFYDSLA